MTINFWHTKSANDILTELDSHERGLSKDEAENRLKQNGPNSLPEKKLPGPFIIFFQQFQSPLIYILLAAAAVVFVIGEIMDGSIILAVLFFNAIVGLVQEGRAQNTLRALKKFTETSATVLRDGKEIIISGTEVVVGDIIILQEGEKIPADARIILSNTLKIDEAILTGESDPSTKTDALLSIDDLPVADQKNMVFKGTNIVSGNGMAVVVATGIMTEVGKIAQKITSINTEIPLKTNIRYLSRLIIITVAIISVVLITLGLLYGKPIQELFITAIALSVSIIPEGLPIVMTLILATGVWRMSKQNALVKQLQAVEALGQTQIIAVDKTGTLTKNEMVIEQIYVDGKIFKINGNGYEPKGEVFLADKIIDPLNHPELLLMGKISAFCANARLSFLEETSTWKVSGDPTEAAMLVFSNKIGFQQDVLEQESPQIFELPFDYKKKYHVVIKEVKKKNFLTVVGAPENVLDICKNVWRGEKSEILNKEEKKNLELIFQDLAMNGFRVVACAINPNVDAIIDADKMPHLTFVGFLAMKDALREEVAEAVEKVKLANMRVVMITGDYYLTAQATAKEAGIYKDGDLVLTGNDIDNLSEEELAEKISQVTVFARVTPDHKLRIIQAYRKKGEIVAMTGDGVNDAPSLVAADLGVAMGKIGTEVAKEASDIVLLDDNFGSIVSAVEEGRGIYKTIKKVILYLFSTSVGEVFTIIGAIILGYALPILPAQIIWLNFVTDGFLDVALAMEPKEKGLLRGSFKRPNKWLLDKLSAQRMFLMAIPMAIGTIFLFREYFIADPLKAWSISLTTLAVFQWFNAWNCRSEDKSIFQINPFSNKFLIGSTLAIIGLQFAALYTPFLQNVLRTTPLLLSEWGLILAVASSIIVVEEIRKFFYRQKQRRSGYVI